MKYTRYLPYIALQIILFSVLLAIAVSSTAFAQSQLTNAHVERGIQPLSVSYLEDQSGSNSVIQASIEFGRMRSLNQLSSNPVIKFGNKRAFYWIELILSNNSKNEEWWFNLEPAEASLPSPIKSLTVYDPNDPQLKPVATWPNTHSSIVRTGVPLTLKQGVTTSNYVLVETWPGINTTLVPYLRTQKYVSDMSLGAAQKASLLWLIMGAVFGIGVVQLLLTRQSVQGALALNALIVGTTVFMMQRHDAFPSLANVYPVLLPLGLVFMLGTGASFMLWTANKRYNMGTLICLVPFALNVIVFAGAAFQLDSLVTHLANVEYFPRYLLAVTGILMLVITMVQGFSNVNMYWFLPAWLALISMPWLGSEYPFAIPVAYVLLLGVAGIAAIFWQWRERDSETEANQKRLRQEVKTLKDTFHQENENWRKKMDTQRDMLNELRMREQQRSAELEVAKKEADEANKAKSDFLAIISHEIRTPMNGIMGIVQILNQTPLNEKQAEYIDVIKNSGDTMLTLLNDILDYSKIEKGVITLESIPFSLRKLVQSVATLMSGRAKDKGISIQVQIDDAVPDYFAGDPQRIRQIMLNLVSNAVKFTEKGGVTIRITPMGSMAKEQTTPVRFEIIDTGIGISQEAQEKLFQAYVQADASISRRFGGTGLGLNICKMLVTAMNGQLGVTSAEGSGSTFWFEIPLMISQHTHFDTQKAEMMHRPQTGKKLYILVIDDNDINLKIVSSLLEMDGHKVVTANSGAKALSLVEQERFDLIFVDILMPGMSGQDFLNKLRDNSGSYASTIPVYALTGMVDPEAKDEILSTGMLGVLTKPITQDALREAIQKVYGHMSHHVNNAIDLTQILAHLDTLSDAEREALKGALQQPNMAPPVQQHPVTATMETVELPPLMAIDPLPVAPVQEHDKPQSADHDMTYLNMTILGELKASLPAETLREIFADLITKSKELTTQIEEAATQSDYTELGEASHNLKGMAGNFGMQGLMDHSGAIEKAVRQGENEKAATLVKESRRVLDASLSALDEWLAS